MLILERSKCHAENFYFMNVLLTSFKWDDEHDATEVFVRFGFTGPEPVIIKVAN